MAQDISPGASEAAATAALAVLGIAATPNDTLPSVSFQRITGEDSRLRSTQFRFGYPVDEVPGLFIEGLLAYQKYNPVLIFPEIAPGAAVNVNWSSVAGTVGVGWDFELRDDWVLRPMGHLSLGYVSTGAFLDNLPILPLGGQSSVEGNLNAGGAGASITLLREIEAGRWLSEYRVRQTYLEFFPINEPRAGDAHANSNQTTFYTRHRLPLASVRLFELPTKAVFDAGVVFYHGDGARVLQAEWLATAGAGVELDVSGTGAPLVKAGRVMLTGVLGEDYSGFTVGFSLSF